MTGLRAAQNLLFVAGAAPLLYQQQYPTRPAASAVAEERVARRDPEARCQRPHLPARFVAKLQSLAEAGEDRAPMTWINSADDFINPRNFTFPEQALKRMPTVRFRLILKPRRPMATAPTPGQSSGRRIW